MKEIREYPQQKFLQDCVCQATGPPRRLALRLSPRESWRAAFREVLNSQFPAWCVNHLLSIRVKIWTAAFDFPVEMSNRIPHSLYQSPASAASSTCITVWKEICPFLRISTRVTQPLQGRYLKGVRGHGPSAAWSPLVAARSVLPIPDSSEREN